MATSGATPFCAHSFLVSRRTYISIVAINPMYHCRQRLVCLQIFLYTQCLLYDGTHCGAISLSLTLADLKQGFYLFIYLYFYPSITGASGDVTNAVHSFLLRGKSQAVPALEISPTVNVCRENSEETRRKTQGVVCSTSIFSKGMTLNFRKISFVDGSR